MHTTSYRAPTGPQPTTRPVPPAQPTDAVATPRDPEPSGLTRDEIRRIVLDLIG